MSVGDSDRPARCVHLRFNVIFRHMRRIQTLRCVATLLALLLLVGCGGYQDGRARLDLRPMHGSGVSGTVYFEDIPDGVVIELRLRDLPQPNAVYLTHIHPGTCARGEKHEEGHTHEHIGEIEFPLSLVKSDSEGRGSSTTRLLETSVEKLCSGSPEHINIHAAGAGDPPVLACADLQEAG